MPDKCWKVAERTIARRLRGQRVGNRGTATPDVITAGLSVEVKTRKALPVLVGDGLLQAEMNRTEGSVPALVLHQVGERHDYDVVCLWLCDFERMTGSAVDAKEAL